ncbi:MAG: hypothetical protein PHO54_05815 [Candidatus Peribacteraceae bacterium]|nr:hypothetical protein [Candidatus Peribacteraceae bacterium]
MPSPQNFFKALAFGAIILLAACTKVDPKFVQTINTYNETDHRRLVEIYGEMQKAAQFNDPAGYGAGASKWGDFALTTVEPFWKSLEVPKDLEPEREKVLDAFDGNGFGDRMQSYTKAYGDFLVKAFPNGEVQLSP